MLNSKDFTAALEIISKHHSTELAINTPKDNFKEYVQGDYKVNEVGNGITRVTSNRAGIALTFADSDLGMYITYMETLA